MFFVDQNKFIIQGKIEHGHRGPGRKQVSWLRNIKQWTGLATAQELMKAAENHEISLPNGRFAQ